MESYSSRLGPSVTDARPSHPLCKRNHRLSPNYSTRDNLPFRAPNYRSIYGGKTFIINHSTSLQRALEKPHIRHSGLMDVNSFNKIVYKSGLDNTRTLTDEVLVNFLTEPTFYYIYIKTF